MQEKEKKQPQDTETTNWTDPLLITLASITGIIIIILVVLIFFGKQKIKPQAPLHQTLQPTLSLPQSTIIDATQPPPQNQRAAIAGTIHIAGTIPLGSIVAVLGRKKKTDTFTNIRSGLAAKDGMTWEWSKAVSGETYDIGVQLQKASGEPLSSNSWKTITAPATDISFFVTSTAK